MITLKTEPAVVSGIIVAAAGTGIAVAVSFGAPISPEQRDTLLAAIPPWVMLIMVAAVWIRSKVVPAAQVVERQDPADPARVLAGEANEIPTGLPVRADLGKRSPDDYQPRHAAE